MPASLWDSSVRKILRDMLFYSYSCHKVWFANDSPFLSLESHHVAQLGTLVRARLRVGGLCAWTWRESGIPGVQWAGMESSQLIQHEFCEDSQVGTFMSGSTLFRPAPQRLRVIKSNLDSNEYNKPSRKEMTVMKRESLSKRHLKWKAWLAQLAPRHNAADEAMTKEYVLSLLHRRVSVFPLLLARKRESDCSPHLDTWILFKQMCAKDYKFRINHLTMQNQQRSNLTKEKFLSKCQSSGYLESRNNIQTCPT